MGTGESIADDLKQGLDLIRIRLEYEDYFSKDGIPFSSQDSREVCNSKQECFDLIHAKAKECRLCSISETKKNLVFGEGSLNAQIMFVGEAPGRDEDLAGVPFVGAAGALLEKIIKAMKLERSDVFITNVLRCRPPENRNPLPDEVENCRTYLFKLIEIIQPKIICTLGKFAAHALLNETRPISVLRGKFYDFEGAKLMPTYHPAYLLRNSHDKKLVWEDIKKIIKYLEKDEA